MTQWLTLSRAARLIGVPRGELQREIRDGRLPANDGMVSTAGLLALYPQMNLEESGAFERVTRLKEEAFGRRVFERALPGREVLAQRLFAQSQELADTRRHLQRYHDLVVALAAAASTTPRAPRPIPALRELRAFLERGLADVLATDTADPIAIMDDMLKVVSAHVSRPAQRPRVLRRGARHAAAGGAQGRAQAQLRLRQRHLRPVQGARRLRRGDEARAARLPAVRGRAAAGPRAAVRALGGVERDRAGDAGGARARATSPSRRSPCACAASGRSPPTRCSCTCRRRGPRGCASSRARA